MTKTMTMLGSGSSGSGSTTSDTANSDSDPTSATSALESQLQSLKAELISNQQALTEASGKRLEAERSNEVLVTQLVSGICVLLQ